MAHFINLPATGIWLNMDMVTHVVAHQGQLYAYQPMLAHYQDAPEQEGTSTEVAQARVPIHLDDSDRLLHALRVGRV